MKKRELIILAGPTAVGKTQAAIDLAKQWNTEIISFDSRQFFREMSIGTAKPSEVQLQEVPHHFIGHISIHEEYNAGRYATDAQALLDTLFEKYERLILVGGSGLYLDALIKGFDELPAGTEKFREQLTNILQEEGIEALQAMLQKLDPEHYNHVDLNNPQRLVRALEVCMATGEPYSSLRKGKSKELNFTYQLIGLDLPREILYDHINRRTMQMMEQGLLEEVKSLVPYKHQNALQTVGYKELFEYLEGKTDLDTAIEKIQQNTRRFAKRQLTWFRRYPEIQWYTPSQREELNKI